MVAVRVSPPFRFVIAGSPVYFGRHGRPATPEDLRHHACIRFRQMSTQGIYRWEFEHGNRAFEMAVNGPLIVNDTSVSIAAAVDGIGLCYTAEPLVEVLVAEGRLELALPDYMPNTPGMFLYYPSRAQAMPKLRAFTDYMRQALADHMRSRP